MKKQPERTARTKQALMDSFWDLYRERRIDQITIKEITANAGFYRSTFYEYFGSVYDVLEEIERNLIEEFKSMFPKLLASKSMEEAFGHISRIYEKNGVYVVILFGPNGDHNFSMRTLELLKSTIASFLDIPEDDMQLNLMVAIFSSSVFAILNYWYTNSETLSLSEVLSAGKEILQHGVLPQLRKMGVEFPEF